MLLRGLGVRVSGRGFGGGVIRTFLVLGHKDAAVQLGKDGDGFAGWQPLHTVKVWQANLVQNARGLKLAPRHVS